MKKGQKHAIPTGCPDNMTVGDGVLCIIGAVVFVMVSIWLIIKG